MKINELDALNYQARDNALEIVLASGTDWKAINKAFTESGEVSVTTDGGSLVERFLGYSPVSYVYQVATGCCVVTLSREVQADVAAMIDQMSSALDAVQATVQATAPVQVMQLSRVLAAQTAPKLSDNQALTMPDLFQTWEEVLEAGTHVEENAIINDGGTLYRVVASGGTTPQEHQPPHGEGMLAVYRPIDQSHAGTAEDPIPWVYGMDCLEGQYFSYKGAVYRVAVGGTMKPCVWAPDTPGLWQWEKQEG